MKQHCVHLDAGGVLRPFCIYYRWICADGAPFSAYKMGKYMQKNRKSGHAYFSTRGCSRRSWCASLPASPRSRRWRGCARRNTRVEATILNSLTPLSKADICNILPDVSPRRWNPCWGRWSGRRASKRSDRGGLRAICEKHRMRALFYPHSTHILTIPVKRG